MSVLTKIVLILALLIMPIGLLMAVEGNYFYDITSRSSINNLMDSAAQDMFQDQISNYRTYCDSFNLSCNPLADVRNSICSKSAELRTAADNSSLMLCISLNMSCNNLQSAQSEICSVFGQNNQACKQLTTISNNIKQSDDACTQLRDAEAQIEAAKEDAYTKDINGFSIARINSLLANAFIIGIILLAISIAMAYAASRNIISVAKTISFTLITTGVTMLIIGYVGPAMVNSMVNSALPEKMAELPASLSNFITGIFSFQAFAGMILTAVGAAGFIAAYAAGKFYAKPQSKK